MAEVARLATPTRSFEIERTSGGARAHYGLSREKEKSISNWEQERKRCEGDFQLERAD